MNPAGSNPDDQVELGSIVGVFGVRGELRVHLHNRESHLMQGRSRVDLILPDGTRRSAFIRCRPGAGKRILAKIDGPTSREEAHALIGTLICVDRADLPKLEEDEFYVYQLLGLQVRCDGLDVGRIVEVHHTASADILEIRVADETLFVPLSPDAVPVVDVEGGFCEVERAALEDG